MTNEKVHVTYTFPGIMYNVLSNREKLRVIQQKNFKKESTQGPPTPLQTK